MLAGEEMSKHVKLKEELRKKLEEKTRSEKIKYLNENFIVVENGHWKRFWYHQDLDGCIAWQSNVFQGSEIII